MSRSSPGFPCGRAEPAPPRGGQAKERRPYGGKPGDDAKGGFLGGTHSVRPLSMAKRVPRDFVFTGWPGEARSPMGTCLNQARLFLAGVRPAPPRRRPTDGKGGWQALGWRQRRFSRRDALCASATTARPDQAGAPNEAKGRSSLRACGARPSAGWPSEGKAALRGKPGDGEKAVFSEGRTLCVRVSMAKRVPRDSVFTGWPGRRSLVTHGDMSRSSPGPPCGRAEPAPPRCKVDHPRARCALGASPGMARKVVFSEGRTLCVRLAWPNVYRGIPFSRDGRAKPGHPRGYVSVKPGPSLRACGARPSAGWPSEGEKALRGQTRRWRERRFSRRDALCASA
jgi:hypothetical protein